MKLINQEICKLGRAFLWRTTIVLKITWELLTFIGRRINFRGRRIQSFFSLWAGEIRCSPGQNKTPVSMKRFKIFLNLYIFIREILRFHGDLISLTRGSLIFRGFHGSGLYLIFIEWFQILQTELLSKFWHRKFENSQFSSERQTFSALRTVLFTFVLPYRPFLCRP